MSDNWSDDAASWNFTPEQRRVLEDVYQRLVEHDRWPTYSELDHDADRHGVEDPLSVMRSLSPAFLRGVGTAGAPSLTQELNLSLRGLVATAGWNAVAKMDLELFLRSVQEAVEVSDRTKARRSKVRRPAFSHAAVCGWTACHGRGPSRSNLECRRRAALERT